MALVNGARGGCSTADLATPAWAARTTVIRVGQQKGDPPEAVEANSDRSRERQGVNTHDGFWSELRSVSLNIGAIVRHQSREGTSLCSSMAESLSAMQPNARHRIEFHLLLANGGSDRGR